MERVEGIEPSPPAWKAGALPLSYTRAPEPSGPGPGAHRHTHTDNLTDSRDWWAEQDSNLRRLSHQIYNLARLTASVSARRFSACEPFSGNTQLVSIGGLHGLIYRQRSVNTKFGLELATGLEPVTSRLQIRCSTVELR